jgi:uridine phosphorylase
MSLSEKMLHINLAKGEVGKYAIIPGDPDRCEKIAAHLENPRKVAQKREFTTYEGYIEGQLITVTSTGIGGPSAAICIEELVKCGADTFIRVGTCASTSAAVSRGDVVVVNGSIRMEGTGSHYLPLEFPAVPDYYLMKFLEETSRGLGFPTSVGISITKDSFYTQTEPETKPVREELIAKWNSYVRGGAIATSMEEATLFLAANSLHVRVASVMVSATNYEGGVSKKNSADVYPTDAIQRPIKVAVETIRKLILSGPGIRES